MPCLLKKSSADPEKVRFFSGLSASPNRKSMKNFSDIMKISVLRRFVKNVE